MAENIKFRPAHEVMLELLENEPYNHFYTTCMILGNGAIVPAKHIPEMIEALKKASREFLYKKDGGVPYLTSALKVLLASASKALKEQLEGAEKASKKKE